MFRKYFTIMLVVLSLCSTMRLCYADYDSLQNNTTIEDEERELGNRKDDTDRFKNEYNKIHGQVKELIDAYDATKAAVKKGQQTIIFRGGAAVLATGAAYLSGGSLAPAAWLAYYTLEEATKTITLDSDQYLEVMGTALSVMDLARANMDAAYNGGTVYDKVKGVETSYTTTGYLKQYETYIKTCAAHGLARLDSNGNVESTPVSETELDTQVNMYNVTRGWYHAGVSQPGRDHVITKRYRPSGVQDDFEKKYKCKGKCKTLYRSPHEALTANRTKCGTGKNIDDELVDAGYEDADIATYEGERNLRLSKRSVEEGCGLYYYTCSRELHKERTCKRWVYRYDAHFKNRYTKTRCRRGFRKCLGLSFDHNPRLTFGRFNHSDVSPDDAEDDSADAGDDSSSAMHACGIHATTVSGSHSRITPPCGDSAHAGYACQISSDHNTEMPGWSGPFYECQPHTTYPCGHTDPTANQAYHAPKTCTLTNAQGDSCVAAGLYECQSSHTCVYSCGRSGCTQTVSSSTQHSATCASGHSYWTCKPYDVKRHITRTCRFSECGKSWQRCMTGGVTPICDKPWRKQNGLRCWQIY